MFLPFSRTGVMSVFHIMGLMLSHLMLKCQEGKSNVTDNNQNDKILTCRQSDYRLNKY
jgi:hypothetical protein